MKKLLLVLTTVCIASAGIADIQSPPGAKYGRLRKLSRGVSNIVYGITEIPTEIVRVRRAEGGTVAAGYGVIHGAGKTTKRFAYGVFEIVTFPFANWKGGFKSGYFAGGKSNGDIHPGLGYEEFPPEVGFVTEVDPTRDQSY